VTVTLVLTAEADATLRSWLEEDRESAGVLLVRVVHARNGDVRLLATHAEAVPEAAYVTRTRRQLRISSEGYVPVLGRAEADGYTPLWLHTHVGHDADPRPSRHDHLVDQQLRDVFRIRSGAELYGSVVVSGGRERLRFTGRIDRDGEIIPIDRVVVVGSRIQVVRRDDAVDVCLDAAFDRNIRAFGGDVQRTLGSLHVAVVGCGGTGSAVAEQLARLGVRRFTLLDPDRLSASNVTRIYGSKPGDVGRLKVDVLAGHLLGIAPDSRIESRPSSIVLEANAREVANVDVVFGCTDDNAGRLVLSRLATYFLLPVFDCGVLLADRDGQIDGIFGRVTVLHPGAACLVCRGRIDLQRAASEALTPGERKRRADEGYAPSMPGVEPAVVAYTTLAAATAVGELLERLVGYGESPAPSEVLLRIHDRETSTNSQAPRAGHYCDPASGKVGRGVTTPFLEQAWVA
jgi:molybdopterin/thiamine biosynthesis adenylyltransferase